jgi:hypothetical protein
MKFRVLVSLLMVSSVLFAGEVMDESLKGSINKLSRANAYSNAVECGEELLTLTDSSCDLSEYEGNYVLDECEGSGRFFPHSVVKVQIKSANGKLDVSYDTIHRRGFGIDDVGANYGYGRIFLNSENKQRASQEGCKIQRRWGLRDYNRVTMDPSTKVVSLAMRNSDFQDIFECTLKRAED